MSLLYDKDAGSYNLTAQDVTLEQLAKVFLGDITNWKEVGGKVAKITIVGHDKSAGSRAT